MTSFIQLSPLARGSILLVLVLLLLIAVYQLTLLIRCEGPTTFHRFAVLCVILGFVMAQLLLAQNKGAPVSVPVPAWAALTVLCLFALLIGMQHRRIRKQRDGRITPMSIKEAVDNLPTGLCFYYPSGLCKMVNTRMEQAAREIAGGSLRDGKRFWEMLSGGRPANGSAVQAGENPIITLENGRAYSFHRNSLRIAGEPLYELTCLDVTREYRLHTELQEARQRARDMNERLRSLNENISELITQKEIWNSKVRLHDDWSRALLMAKRYILDPDHMDRANLFRTWQRNIRLLEAEQEPAAGDTREDILAGARELGVDVIFNGTLPDAPELNSIVDHAIVVCVSNTVQHAHGGRLTIRSLRQKGGCRILFTNNGDAPKSTVRETGGLADLRRRVERSGGKMTIKSRPRFELQLEFGREEHAL